MAKKKSKRVIIGRRTSLKAIREDQQKHEARRLAQEKRRKAVARRERLKKALVIKVVVSRKLLKQFRVRVKLVAE